MELIDRTDIRPGISPESLATARIRHVSSGQAKALCGIDQSGLWIPYHDIDGRPVDDSGSAYGRLRLDDPMEDRKYHQRAKSGVHAYFPPNFRPKPGGDLVLVEGEFKALSLHESNITAIGMSGFYGAMEKGAEDFALLPEVAAAIERIRPSRILFLGDSDTALNIAFSAAGIEVTKLVSPIPVFLPRVALNQPKGIDDCREKMGYSFSSFWEEITSNAIAIEPEMNMGDVAIELLDRERDSLMVGVFGMPKRKAEKRLIEIGAAISNSAPLSVRLFIELAAAALGTGKREIQSAIKEVTKARRLARRHGDISIDSFVFDGRKYFRLRDGQYETLSREDVMLHLEAEGASRCRVEGEAMSPAEGRLLEIQNDHRADYCGPICGRPAGLFSEGGRKILATTSPKIVAPSDQPNPGPLFDFFTGLLGKGQDNQSDLQMGLFMGWIKQFRRALADPSIHLPGHLLGLIGERDCGKSLGQDLITHCAGGRSSDCSSWLQGRSDFNSQLWGAEHLVLSDANLEDDARVKQGFRDAIKGIVANHIYPLTRKQVDEISLRPIWRISLSANDDSQSAGVIPNPISDPSLADKVMYLKCYPPLKPFHGNDPQDRLRFWQSLIADIPNFLAAVELFEVDQEWQKGRFGVKEWVHPDIAALLDSSNPDRETIDFIEDFMENRPMPFEGRAKDLYSDILSHSEGRFGRCCKNSLVLSHALKRIANLPDWKDRIEYHPDRFGENRQKGLRFTIRIGLDR